ncbi:MAG: aspartate-semialdehyde dehydrogenase [Holosporales bacterium]|jgi:aspartate-semialdehyde dehydrogenase|nr:aspartate-semialdehyde dehydrogenase [Holosporales bacterium]
MNSRKIIIIGATGRVGREMLSILSEEKIPQDNVFACASSLSEGVLLSIGNYSKLKVQVLENVDFSKYHIALFSAGSKVSQLYVSKAAKAGCLIIDNTSYFRMHADIPLIIPEVNFEDIERYRNKMIISNPNCSTIQMVMALKPLHDLFGLKEVVVSTYQSTSGAGQKGVSELLEQTKEILNNKPIFPKQFKKQIAFNVIPQIDEFTDSFYTKEELKMMNETKKILRICDLAITATCVRVPVLIGHSVSVYADFEKEINLNEAIQALSEFKGVQVIQNSEQYEYATAIDCEHKNDVFISRIRKHPEKSTALTFWCVCDNLRKGAALNAIQIAKRIFST